MRFVEKMKNFQTIFFEWILDKNFSKNFEEFLDRVSRDEVFCGFCDEKWRVRFLLIFGKVFFKRLWKRIFELFLKIFEKDPKFEEILNKFLDNF